MNLLLIAAIVVAVALMGANIWDIITTNKFLKTDGPQAEGNGMWQWFQINWPAFWWIPKIALTLALTAGAFYIGSITGFQYTVAALVMLTLYVFFFGVVNNNDLADDEKN